MPKAKTKIIKKSHLLTGGIAIFLLGFILGAVLLLANFRSVMELLRPDPHGMTEKLAERVTTKLSDNFDIPSESKENITAIIISSQPKFDSIFVKVKADVDKYREQIIESIAAEIPNITERQEFLENAESYLPKAPPGRPPHGPPPL